MTRYTKLEKRKAPHKATDYFQGDFEDVQTQTAAPEASTSAATTSDAQEESSTSSSAAKKRKVSPSSTGDDTTTTDVEGVSTDPHRLQKRLKLLRLKAKTAKSDEKRSKLRSEIKTVEAQIKVENGKRGGSDATSSSPRTQPRSRPLPPSVTEETNPWKKMEAERRLKSSAKADVRREKRSQERAAGTRCFACRAMGHAAKDCPQALNSSSTALEGEEVGGGGVNGGEVSSSTAGLTGKETVGLCFRCGSTSHILSRCRRPAPTVGPDLPFATCFVCGSKGHLSSRCSQNAGKGVYPNGGCCKLCQSVEHLAKDCPLRRSETTQASNATQGMWGAGRQWEGQRGGGADDDDFHAFARKKWEVEREEAGGAARQGQHAAKGAAAAPRKKVVSF